MHACNTCTHIVRRVWILKRLFLPRKIRVATLGIRGRARLVNKLAPSLDEILVGRLGELHDGFVRGAGRDSGIATNGLGRLGQLQNFLGVQLAAMSRSRWRFCLQIVIVHKEIAMIRCIGN